jgi:hypothetical protein
MEGFVKRDEEKGAVEDSELVNDSSPGSGRGSGQQPSRSCRAGQTVVIGQRDSQIRADHQSGCPVNRGERPQPQMVEFARPVEQRLIDLSPSGLKTLDTSPSELVLFERGCAFPDALQREPTWTLVYRDRQVEVCARTSFLASLQLPPSPSASYWMGRGHTGLRRSGGRSRMRTKRARAASLRGTREVTPGPGDLGGGHLPRSPWNEGPPLRAQGWDPSCSGGIAPPEEILAAHD